MIYGNKKILELLEEGKIGIYPFNPEQLQGVSYDLRVDKFFIQFLNSGQHNNPSHGTHTFEYSVTDKFLLYPQKRVLASTIEKIGSRDLSITTKIFSKSSWARHGMEVCSCAGYGDPGYYNHWTLEIFNKNSYPIEIEAGMIIAQMSFEETEGCSISYISKYNNHGQDDELLASDRFVCMLPKLIKKVL